MTGGGTGEIVICRDAGEVAREAARRFAEAADLAVNRRGRFTVALSGGSTPRQLYALLADAPYRDAVPWTHTHIFWGDERCMPPDHPESNYGLAREALLSKVPVPDGHVHRMVGECADPEAAAAQYEQVLRVAFGPGRDQIPRFDLILLGLGEDGHTASLFPGTPALEEWRRLVAASFVPRLNAWRLTLTLPVLNHAAMVMFLVVGRGKAAVLREVLEDVDRADSLPAQRVQPEGGVLVWLVDQDAAALLSGHPS